VYLPDSVRKKTMLPTTTTTVPPRMTGHHCVRKSVNPSRMRVASGNSALKSAKNVLNRGSTKPTSTVTVTTAITAITIGYVNAAFTARRVSRSRSM
jgi:hypothetical protein